MNEMTDIRKLFNKLLDNSITEEELDDLLAVVSDPETERKLKIMMEDHWEEIENKIGHLPSDLRARKQFSRITQQAGLTRRNGKVDKGGDSEMLPRLGQWAMVAASMLVLVLAGLYWFTDSVTTPAITLSEPEIARSFHGKQIVTLPDGSTVILNEESRLSFRENFGIENREVIFVGEGYFDIVHDPERPFIVHTGQVNSTVLGTAFNLIAYEDQSEILVTVERGEVAVGDQEKIYDHILPEEQLVINTRTLHVEKERVDLDRVLAWKENFLILDDVTIRIAAEMIAKRYGVAVSVENEEMKNCMINAAFLHGETLEQVLRVLCGVLQADFSVENQEVTIKGGRACI